MSEKVTVLIVEDDPIIAADLKFFMKDFGYAPFPAVADAEQALLMLESITPDFILMDVSLEGEVDGIELAEKINQKMDVPIIFLTAHHDKKTIDRIKTTQPSAYLVKPLQEHNLKASIELALYNHNHQKLEEKPDSGDDFVSGNYIFFKVKNQLKKVQLDDILFFEAYDNYSFLHTAEDKFLIGSSLKAVETKLAEHDFIRTHRGTVVNIKSVEGIQEDVILMGKHQLPIGKTYREAFMKRIQTL